MDPEEDCVDANAGKVAETEQQIVQLGEEIRDLKQTLKQEPSDNEKAIIEAQIKTKVATLLQLKQSLPNGHHLRPEERSKELEKKRSLKKQAEPYRMLTKGELAHHTVQRKIHNLFAKMTLEDDTEFEEVDEGDIEGATVSSFQLDKTQFNVSKTGLDFNTRIVLATEKWDGTTLQADRRGIFKRRDLIARGDPKKFTACEQERYSLIHLDIHHTSNRHIKRALGKHLDVLLNKIPEGVTLYFEAVGPRIQSRYRDAFGPNMEGGLIRVFDASRDGKIIPFADTQQLAQMLGLPVVHSFEFSTPASPKTEQDAIDLILKVKQEHTPYTCSEQELLAPVELEGYVFRCPVDSSRIAKLRVSDLAPLGYM